MYYHDSERIKFFEVPKKIQHYCWWIYESEISGDDATLKASLKLTINDQGEI